MISKIALFFSIAAVSIAPVARADTSGKTSNAGIKPTPAVKAMERIKSLVGDWEAKAPKIYGDASIRLNYRLISDDSALMETFRIPEHDVEMITIYHLDDERLVLTHFCAVNNQVRMNADLAKMPADKGIEFNFVDASNLARASKQVMDKLTITFEDSNHFVQAWRWREKKAASGSETAVYRYTRK